MYRLLLVLPLLCILWVGAYTGPSVIQDSQSLALVGSELPDCNTSGLYDKHCSDKAGYTCPASVTYKACKAAEGSTDGRLCKSGEGAVQCNNGNCTIQNGDATNENCKKKS